ncbi:hypothetical protein IWQ61_000150 [Dispira simplex]|nr:hypothetical protein IWQ61_000150 [Dispira simplex]
MPLTPVSHRWTEHRGPDGTPYYYDHISGTSVWERPPEFVPPEAPEKERPQSSHTVSGTPWTIVTTNANRVYYYNNETKVSEWQVPEEIADQVRVWTTRTDGPTITPPTNGVTSATESARPTVDGLPVQDGTEMTEEDMAYQLEQMEAGEENPESIHSDAPASGVSPNDSISSKAGIQQDLTPEESNQQFKQLLRDKNVSPFSTWEREFHHIINDPRYALVKTLKQRKELFDEYCAEKAAQKRASSSLDQASDKNPRDAFRQLLTEHITSDTTLWREVQRKFRKHPAWLGLRSTKEKEAIFRAHTTSLKESQARGRRTAFLQLLKDTPGIHARSRWHKCQSRLEHAPAYHAIATPHEREAIFQEYITSLNRPYSRSRSPSLPRSTTSRRDRHGNRASPSPNSRESSRYREMESLRRRAREVERDRRAQRWHASQSREQAKREEIEQAFQAWLVDKVKTHRCDWSAVCDRLRREHWERNHGEIDRDRLHQLFKTHQRNLYDRRLKAFHDLLDQTVSDFKIPWEDVYPRIASHSQVEQLEVTPEELKRLYSSYTEARYITAQQDLKQLVRENWFAQFQLRQALANESVCHALRDKRTADIVAATLAEEEGRDAEEISQDMASSRETTSLNGFLSDLKHLYQILARDSRYLAFHQFPEERDRIIRDALESMIESAAKQSAYGIVPGTS